MKEQFAVMETSGGKWQWPELGLPNGGDEYWLPFILYGASAVLTHSTLTRLTWGYIKSGLYQLFLEWHNIQNKVCTNLPLFKAKNYPNPLFFMKQLVDSRAEIKLTISTQHHIKLQALPGCNTKIYIRLGKLLQHILLDTSPVLRLLGTDRFCSFHFIKAYFGRKIWKQASVKCMICENSVHSQHKDEQAGSTCSPYLFAILPPATWCMPLGSLNKQLVRSILTRVTNYKLLKGTKYSLRIQVTDQEFIRFRSQVQTSKCACNALYLTNVMKWYNEDGQWNSCLSKRNQLFNISNS